MRQVNSSLFTPGRFNKTAPRLCFIAKIIEGARRRQVFESLSASINDAGRLRSLLTQLQLQKLRV